MSICECCLLGAPLHAILSAGEWRSPAFLSYLDVERLEKEAIVQAHVDESDSDGEIESAPKSAGE